MTSRRIGSMFAAAVLLLGVSMPVLNAGTTVWLATVWIDDIPDGKVASDGHGPYVDYRIGPSLFGETNYCVEASPTNQMLFVRLNRPVTDTQYCEQTPSRQFFLTIGNPSACDELRAHFYLTTPPTGSPCTITGLDKPRIRISSDLWARRTTKTAVAFLTEPYDVNATSYEVRTETDATVTPSGPNLLVQYGGDARLYRFAPRVSGVPVPYPFPLPFQMTVTRQVAQ